jgi:hypothetical protein
MSAAHHAAIQAQRSVAPMSPARLAEIRRMRGGPMLRECVVEIDRLLLMSAPSGDRTALDLQLSINRALMERLRKLEARVSALDDPLGKSEPHCVCGHVAEEHDCIGPTSDCLNTRCQCTAYRPAGSPEVVR